MRRLDSRYRSWLYIGGLIGLAVVITLAYIWHLKRMGNVDFADLAAMSQGEALETIKRNSTARAMVKLRIDKEVVESKHWLKPGMSEGIKPRFANIGETDALVYQGTSGTWYVLGKIRVLDYVDGQWREVGVFANRKFVYDAGN